MTLSSAVIERLPYVEGVLKYLAPAAAKPMNLAYDPGPGVPRSTGVAEPHAMPNAMPPGRGSAVARHRRFGAGRAAQRGQGLLRRGRAALRVLSRSRAPCCRGHR